jgi:hypothetical protein
MNANVFVLEDAVRRRFLLSLAWMTILLISDLPDIIWHTFGGSVPAWIFWSKIAVLVLLLAVCAVSKSIRSLWQFAAVMLVFYLAFAVSTWIGNASCWTSRFAGLRVTFTVAYLGAYIRDTGIALAVIAALWLMKNRRSKFFLVKGQLDAPIGPVRWLGIGRGESWRTFGWIFAIVATLVVLIPTALGLRRSSDALLRAVPLLPSALLFAAINAFNEEVYFRLSLLSTLTEVIGKTHTLLINIVFFGLAHYLHGSPPGVTGFLLTGFLAWLLGKSLLETKGMAWAWLMHFMPDAVIFASYCVVWVQK